MTATARWLLDTGPSAEALEVEIIDPLTMPIPAAWDAFRCAERLPASWDGEALRLLAWTSRRPVRLAIVTDRLGVVAIVCGDIARTAAAYVEPGSPLPIGWFSCRLLVGYRPGVHFRSDAPTALRRQAVRAFERGFRRHHRRCLGFVYENVEAPAPFGRRRLTRSTSPGHRVDIRWTAMDDYFGHLPAHRRKRLRRLFHDVERSERLMFTDRLDIDPLQAAELDLQVRLKHAGRRQPPSPLSPGYLARLAELNGTHLVGYRDLVDGDVVAFDLLVEDHSQGANTLMAVVHGSVDRRDDGIRNLYFDLYLREIELAIGRGFDAVDFGPGLPELKQRFGARPVPTSAAVSIG